MKNFSPETGCSRVGVIAGSSTRETAINTPVDTKCVASEWKYFSYCGRINSVVRALACRTVSISGTGPILRVLK